MINIIYLIAIIECLIGLVTVVALALYPGPPKPPAVSLFVFIAAAVSFTIGLGLFYQDERARRWLVYFSGYICLEKLLIFMGVLTLNGQVLPAAWSLPKDALSFTYHAILVALLSRPSMTAFFRPLPSAGPERSC
ncbi:MAG: hypothetical protein MOGMAGMI_01689 [Candidatus Omnitrophica bacterium]|nr:hypothetical protein [Candidatus Omnitrophota bacterium]